MQMMNKAIEDASDFSEFQRKLMQETEKKAVQQRHASILETLVAKQLEQPPRRPGENREQYRARVFGKEKA